jgi:hypothetical protein
MAGFQHVEMPTGHHYQTNQSNRLPLSYQASSYEPPYQFKDNVPYSDKLQSNVIYTSDQGAG